MTKSYSNLRSLLFVCAVFLLSNFYSFSAFSQCNPAASDASFNPLDTIVNGYDMGYPLCIVNLPNNKILLGGEQLRIYNSQIVNGIARLNEDGTLDNTFSLYPHIMNVKDIEVQSDTKILIAGETTNAANELKHLIRLNYDGSLDSTFVETSILQSTSRITIIKLQLDGKILVGGELSVAGTNTNLIRLNSNGSLDSTFLHGYLTPIYSIGWIEDIVVQDDGRILVGGDFAMYNSFSNTVSIVRLNSDGSVDTSFNQGGAGLIGGSVESMVVDANQKLVIVGSFVKYNNIDNKSIVRLNQDGSIDNSFSSPVTPSSFAGSSLPMFLKVALQGNKLVVISANTTIYGIFIRLNQDGSIDTNFGNNASRYLTNFATMIVLPNHKILTNYGIGSYLIDRLDENGIWDNTFNSNYGFNRDVSKSILSQDKLYTFGQFLKYNNSIAYCVAKLNLDGTQDATFNLDSRYINVLSFANTIAVQNDNKVLIGGRLSGVANGIYRKALLRFKDNGLIDTTFNANDAISNYSATVTEITIQNDGKLVITGENFSLNRNSGELRRLNSDGSNDNSFSSTGVNGYINSIVLQNDGKMIVSGNFNTYNGVAVSHIVRVMPNGDFDPTFNVDIDSVTFTQYVKLLTNGDVLIALKKSNGSIELRKVDNLGNIDPNFSATFQNTLYIKDIAVQNNGKLVVVGGFNQVNGINSNNIVQLNTDGSIDSTFDVGVGTDGAIKNVHLLNDNSILITGIFTNYNAVTRNKIAKLKNDNNVLTNTTSPQSQRGLCLGDTTILQTIGQGIVYWYDSPTSTTPIGIGNNFTTPALATDSTYFYAQDSIIACGVSQRLEIMVTTIQELEAVSKSNYTAYLDSTGQIELNAVLLDSSSITVCGSTITSYLFDDTGLATRSFSCADTNSVHNLILRVTDNNGNTDISSSIVQIKDAIAPIVSTRIVPVNFTSASNQVIISARDFITSMRDNCTDSTDLEVVFEDTGLEYKTITCNSITSLLYRIKITDRNENFVIKPVNVSFSSNSYDFNVNIIAPTFRPFIASTIKVLVNNYSCAPKSGELKVTLPTTVTFNGAFPAPTRIVGNDLFWNVTDLNYDRNFIARISVVPDVFLNMGNEICFTGHITPEISDIATRNNLKAYCFPIINSYDPNDKQVYPQGICTDKFTKRSDLPLTYTIRFQNTGNAPALNVKITDSLSSLLNRRSLRVVGSSHAMVVDTTANNNVINFRFNNINLPDSTTNAELSQGYVIFELSEIAAHTDTSRINNKSYIYFDTNPAIITNTVKNTIVNVLPLCTPPNPNPTVANCTLPTNLRAEILTSNKVKLLWTNPTGTNAINYEILRNGQRLITVPASNLSFVDSTLIANTQYNYSIKAICGNNDATSNSVQVRTIPATPILLSVVAACKGEKGKINVQSAGATYRVYSSQTATTPLFETNNASIETPILNDSTTFYISVIINGLESQRLKAIVPIKEVVEAKIEQGNLFETCATQFNLSAKNVVGATYTWFRENVEVGTERTLTTTFAARYKVRVVKNGCFADSEFTTTRFVSAPTAKIKQGTTISFCGSGTLNAQDTSSNVVYEWTLNGTNVGNGTAINVSQTGTYTLKASQPSCESNVTITVTITNAPANVALTASKTAICTGSEALLSATMGTGFTYKWFKNNVVISNTSATLSTSEIGKYKVEVTTADGCKVTTSEVEITRLQASQAFLRINAESGKDKTIDVTSQDAIDSVQWFKDGVLIPAFANQRLITPTQTGNYKAKVTYSTGCKFETTEKVFTIGGVTGIEEESAKIFTIYPNPNTGSFKVEFAQTTNQKTNLTLIDGLGRIIHSQEIAKNERNEKVISITLPKISAGVYVVQIISEGKVYTKQLIIQ